MKTELPPGPRMPAATQSVDMWARPLAFLERCRERYGPRFTIRILGQPSLVILSTPEEVKELFMAPPDVLHPGEGARLLEPLLGPESVILRARQRRKVAPAPARKDRDAVPAAT